MFTFGNFNMAFPKPGEDETGVTKVILSQSLSDELVVFAGKINSLDDFVLEFTGRNGVERFMNSGMVANIINARTVPYSTYGAGLSVLRDDLRSVASSSPLVTAGNRFVSTYSLAPPTLFCWVR
jgi:porin